MRTFGAESPPPNTLPPDHGWHYPEEHVWTGFLMWHNSGYARIPGHEEVARLSDEWVADLSQMLALVRFYTEPNPARAFINEDLIKGLRQQERDG